MDYIPQEHDLGCMIAAAAMVLNMTYKEVARTVPLQDPKVIEETGHNALGEIGIDEIDKLALKHGIQMKGFEKGDVLVAREGFRYIAVIPRTMRAVHCVAIDETGMALDPDPDFRENRCHWSSYDILALLEFHPNLLTPLGG